MEVNGAPKLFDSNRSSILLCSAEERNSYRFATTWGWQNFHFPLSSTIQFWSVIENTVKKKLQCKSLILNNLYFLKNKFKCKYSCWLIFLYLFHFLYYTSSHLKISCGSHKAFYRFPNQAGLAAPFKWYYCTLTTFTATATENMRGRWKISIRKKQHMKTDAQGLIIESRL